MFSRKGYFDYNRHMEWKKNWQWLLSPINNEGEAAELLIVLSKGWYGLGAIQMAFGALMIYGGAPLSAFADGVAYVFAGYFLKKRKSRTLAMIMLLYSLIIAALTFASNFGLYEGVGGTNIVLAILAICLAWRTNEATNVYHDSIESKVEWKNVAVVWMIVLVLSLITGILVILVSIITEIADSTGGRIMILALMGLWSASFMLLTKRFPFTIVENGESKDNFD